MSPRRILVPFAILVLLSSACTSGDSNSEGSSDATTGSLPEAAQEIIQSEPYEHGRWSWYAADTAGGDALLAQDADVLTLLGSTTKLFTVGTYLDTIGADSTLETPVYAVGNRSGGTLEGDLVLVGSGDFILGSRGVSDGDPQFAEGIDHVYFYASPTAEPVAEDPLAGLDTLAEQVATAGITSVDGDVLVDDRLWDAYETKEGVLTSIMVNDNLLDIEVSPGIAVGDAATLEMRPETAFFDVVNEVTTGEANTDPDLATEAGDGNQVIVSGVIPADSDALHTAYFAPDPAEFARALFIEALQRAGVEVVAPLAGNDKPLPDDGSYTAEMQVAALESPSASKLSFLIDKISHNRGAETLMCLLAVEQGSRDCEDGLKPILETIDKAEIDQSAVFLVDGEGSDPNSATPRAMVQWLTWMNERPWADALRNSLPVIDDDGKILTKSGTSAAVEPTTGRLLMSTEAQAGYLETDDGSLVAIALYMNNGVFESPEEGLFQAKDDTEAVLSAIQGAL